MKFNQNSFFAGAALLMASLLSGSGCKHCSSCTSCATPNTAATAIPMTQMVNPPATPVAIPTGKIALKFVKVDSEETAGENGAGANAVDGDPNTIWHTQWQDASPECPHEIVIELAPPSAIKGFTYLPRQDDSDHGQIKGYEFYVSDDGQNFGEPVVKGEFENTKDLKTATFAPKTCRFIKLKAVSEVNGEAYTSAAEIGVIAE